MAPRYPEATPDLSALKLTCTLPLPVNLLPAPARPMKTPAARRTHLGTQAALRRPEWPWPVRCRPSGCYESPRSFCLPGIVEVDGAEDKHTSKGCAHDLTDVVIARAFSCALNSGVANRQ